MARGGGHVAVPGPGKEAEFIIRPCRHQGRARVSQGKKAVLFNF